MYDSLQDQILSLIEEGRTDLDSQLQYWHLERKLQAILYYAKKNGYRHLGLQQVPAAIASEVKGKNAIAMTLLLESLAKTQFANETWTLGDTGAELVLATEPKQAFKKQGYEVTVYFDNDRNNSYPYTNWEAIYIQQDGDIWIKARGLVDYNGLYYEEPDQTKAYFTLFADNAQRFGQTGKWTVQYKNKTIYPPVTSSRPTGGSTEEGLSASGPEYTAGPSTTSVRQTASVSPQQSSFQAAGATTPTGKEEARVGSRRRQGEQKPESSVKRARADSSVSRQRSSPHTRGGRRRGGRDGGQSPVPASEVGRHRQTVARGGLSRLERLQEEARDPPIILVTGHPNTLKCWRNRLPRISDLYTNASTVFRWVVHNNTADQQGRVLVAFASTAQRSKFLCNVTIPRTCTYTYGSISDL